MATKEKGKSQAKQTERDNLGPTKVKFEESPTPINVWSTSALKNNIDDTVKKIVKEEFDLVENFNLMDQRLAICTIACSFSMGALVYDYLNPFPASRIVLAVCALSYFLMMGVLTLFTIYQEDNTFMLALEKDKAGVDPDNVWKFQSILPRFSDKYLLRVTFQDGHTKKTRKAEFEKSVANWFDEKGTISCDKFFVDVKNLYTEIGKSKKDN